MAAAYQNAGPTLNTSGMVIPNTPGPDAGAFDRLQNALRQGLVTQQEIADTLTIKPLQQAVQRDQLQTALEVRPRATQQALEMGDLQLQKGQAELSAFQADPTGARRALQGQLSKYGLTSTGDSRLDAANLQGAITKVQKDISFASKVAMIASETGLEQLPNETDEAYVLRASKEIPQIKDRLAALDEDRKTLEGHNRELVKAGKAPVKTIAEATSAFAALRGEEKAAKDAEAAAKAGQKAPSAEDKKVMVYLAEMAQSNKVLSELETTYKPEKALFDAFLPDMAATNWMRSPQGQAYLPARNKWIEAVLRERSGAAIATAEYDKAAKQYFPQLGDTPEVVKNKKNLRNSAESAMKSTLQAGGVGKVFTADGTAIETSGAPDSPQGPPAPEAPAPFTLPPGVKPSVWRGKNVFVKSVGNGKSVIVDANGNPVP